MCPDDPQYQYKSVLIMTHVTLWLRFVMNNSEEENQLKHETNFTLNIWWETFYSM